ncbi:MAG: TlpA family protein disulfide reductase [Deltaproteobacteria bacterium]|nr:TlpA family protein disulfide reductase [Deltaproteobacteria bacterium]
MPRNFFGGILLLGLLLGLACTTGEKGIMASPEFAIVDLEGNNVTYEQFKGKVLVLDFWATWCPPCRKSIPELIALQDRYGGEGLVILGVSMDHPQKVSDEALSAFKEEYRINYTILRANSRVIQDFFQDEKIAIPTMFVVNREGRIVDKHVGFSPGAVEGSLKKLF